MDELIVCPKEGERVSRAFSVRLVGYVTADPMWELGRSGAKARRPVWLSYMGTEAQVRAFTANARKGRRLQRVEGRFNDHETLEVPKSARFRCEVQRIGESSVATLYHPELCSIEPMVPDAQRIDFLSVIPAKWVDRQVDAAHAVGTVPPEDVRDAIVAARAAACLDRRCPLPIVGDLAFHLRLYRAGLEVGLFREEARTSYGMPQIVPDAIPAVERVVACCATQEAFAELLKRETAAYFGGSSHGAS